jgi:hypothetical protein
MAGSSELYARQRANSVELSWERRTRQRNELEKMAYRRALTRCVIGRHPGDISDAGYRHCQSLAD